jgi:hypothetical protein
MPVPLALAVCEDDLRRDLTFLKEFAGTRIDLRVTPMSGGTFNPKVVRLLGRQARAAKEANLSPQAIVVHHDVDRLGSLQALRSRIHRWFQGSELRGIGRLVVCAPVPCTEAWLCEAVGIQAAGASPAAGCDPWKHAWERRGIPDLDRVRDASRLSRRALAAREDFSAFYRDWVEAGLEPEGPAG